MSKRKSEAVKFERTVTFLGDSKQNALEALYEGPEETLPVIKSVGFMRMPDLDKKKRPTFVSYVLHSRGPRVIKMEVNEPNLRGIAEDEAKIAFVQCFMDDEFVEATRA